MNAEYENVLVDQPVEGVARILLNRPERLNALTYDLVNDIHKAL